MLHTLGSLYSSSYTTGNALASWLNNRTGKATRGILRFKTSAAVTASLLINDDADGAGSTRTWPLSEGSALTAGGAYEHLFTVAAGHSLNMSFGGATTVDIEFFIED